jgi:penicillin-binding protein 2
MLQGRRPFEPVPILFELSEEQIARIAVNQFRLPGVEVSAQLVRHYPHWASTSHSVGYVGRINEQELKKLDPVNYSGTHHIGKTGIEKFYEEQLHGQVGYEEVETNARGRVLRVLKRTDPIAGKDIHLTSTHAAGSRRGSAGRPPRRVVAIEPAPVKCWQWSATAELRPQPVRHRHRLQGLQAELRDSIDRPLYNRALRGLYPPGSTIKPMVALAGLDAGVITPRRRVFDPGFYQLPGRTATSTATGTAAAMAGWTWNGPSCAPMTPTSTTGPQARHRPPAQLHEPLRPRPARVAGHVEEAAGLMPSREWKRARHRQPGTRAKP